MTLASRAPHYAWTVALAGALAVFCCLGLARFAFGMLLPSMSAALALDYGQRGALGSSYLSGYVLAVAFVPLLARRHGQRRLITAGLALIALSMTGMVLSGGYLALCLLYGATGIGSGAVFVPVMSLASLWFHPSHRGLAAGLLLAGAGLGIIVSGFVTPALGPVFGLAAWRVGWLLFAAISAVTAVIAWTVIRNHPAELDRAPYGAPAPRSGAAPAKPQHSRARLVAHLGAIYAIYGVGYMIYASFIVTSMVESYALTEAEAGGLWAGVGFLSMFSGALFGSLSDRLGRRAGFAAAFVVLALAFVLVARDFGLAGLYPSIVLYGLAAWSVPTVIAAASGDYFGPAGAASGLAAVTLIFAVGQAVGPAFAGLLAEITGDFSASYAVSAGAALVAVLLCLLLRDPAAAE